MNESELLREVGHWLRFAHDDLLGAEALLEREDVAPRLACFHAQQSAEKALKALLIFREVEPPRIHDLFAVREMLPKTLDVGVVDQELVALSKWAVELRYPGELPQATAEDARTAIEQAREVYEKALEDLKRHGYDAAAGHSEG